jgi:hypothetical protein
MAWAGIPQPDGRHGVRHVSIEYADCSHCEMTEVDFSADYENIDPKYGTLEEWDRLVAGVHARGMKLV